MITLDYPAPGFLTPKTSKYSGFGYIPKSQPYPTNSHGQPLSLLAQINFDEIAAYRTLSLHGDFRLLY
ncbi:DUF1963 domain-containing protein [Weissella viridescens]|uniref:DUF1963 domain-containing protein n=1 Tax=Weissella viridescens TaxID=1629 RepID=UPI0040577207